MDAKIDLSEGEEVDFENEKGEWNFYKLADGSTLKVKLILVNVVRSRNKCRNYAREIWSQSSPAECGYGQNFTGKNLCVRYRK